MGRRTLCLVVPVACLVGSAAWRLVSGPEAARHSSALQPAPSEAAASDGAMRAAPAAEQEPTLQRAAFPIRQATTPAEVREVLRLTREATLEDRPALLDAALHAEDPLVAGNAVQALGRLKALRGDEALLALIEDPRVRVRQDAVVACGLDGDARSIPHLAAALGRDDAAVQPLVLEALGRIGGPEAHALLAAAAEDPTASKTERVFARAALQRTPR